MYHSAARAYRDTHIETASPARLLDELYLRLLRDMREAQEHIARWDIEKKGMAINHANAIVTQLVAALDDKVAPDLVARLRGLYGFVLQRLLQANLRIDGKPLDGAIEVITRLRDGFSQVAAR